MIAAQLQAEDFKVVVTADGKPFTEYRYGHFVCRPYFYPVLTPDGQRLTRGYPVETFEGETDDHYHHRGIYGAHGDVNGHDLWMEKEGHGSLLQRGIPEVGDEDGVVSISGIVDWFGCEGEKLLEEARGIRIAGEGDIRIIDHRSELRAVHGAVRFGDTKEGGLIAIRVPTSMDAQDRGRIENSDGLVFDSGQGEEVTWGKPAAWVDYSGPLANGDEWGFTVVDHRSNPLHPTHWHVRGYGLFTANPFGLHHFKNDDSVDGSMEVPAGDKAVFSYRIIIHPGRGLGGDARIAELIEEYQAG